MYSSMVSPSCPTNQKKQRKGTIDPSGCPVSGSDFPNGCPSPLANHKLEEEMQNRAAAELKPSLNDESEVKIVFQRKTYPERTTTYFQKSDLDKQFEEKPMKEAETKEAETKEAETKEAETKEASHFSCRKAGTVDRCATPANNTEVNNHLKQICYPEAQKKLEFGVSLLMNSPACKMVSSSDCTRHSKQEKSTIDTKISESDPSPPANLKSEKEIHNRAAAEVSLSLHNESEVKIVFQRKTYPESTTIYLQKSDLERLEAKQMKEAKTTESSHFSCRMVETIDSCKTPAKRTEEQNVNKHLKQMRYQEAHEFLELERSLFRNEVDMPLVPFTTKPSRGLEDCGEAKAHVDEFRLFTEK